MKEYRIHTYPKKQTGSIFSRDHYKYMLVGANRKDSYPVDDIEALYIWVIERGLLKHRRNSSWVVLPDENALFEFRMRWM